VRDLTKDYGAFLVVNHISLVAPQTKFFD